MKEPALLVVGTGIRVVGQLTTEAVAWIKISDQVFYLAHDPVAGEILSELNPTAESLAGLYVDGKPRRQAYRKMVERVLYSVRAGKRTCLVFYGHPGVFCWPGHEAIRQTRREGYTAKMVPAISAEDCLFADLGLDPGTHGCLSYEATDFLMNIRPVDPSCLLILWQVGALGDRHFRTNGNDLAALPLLIEKLGRIYDRDQEVIVYAAPIRWGGEPVVERVRLGRLTDSRLSSSSTLCLPSVAPNVPDREVYNRLHLPLPDEGARALQCRSRNAKSKRTPSGVPSPVQALQRPRAR